MTTTKIHPVLLSIFVMFPSVVGAQDFDGLYRPDYPWAEGWRCNVEYLGSDGGALGIFGDQLFVVENTCNLTDPRPENAGVRYTAVCSGEGETYTQEYLIQPTATGIKLTRDGETVEWRRCEEGPTGQPGNEWVAGFGMGVAEVSTHDGMGNSVMLTCTGGQDGQVFVSFQGVPLLAGPSHSTLMVIDMRCRSGLSGAD